MEFFYFALIKNKKLLNSNFYTEINYQINNIRNFFFQTLYFETLGYIISAACLFCFGVHIIRNFYNFQFKKAYFNNAIKRIIVTQRKVGKVRIQYIIRIL